MLTEAFTTNEIAEELGITLRMVKTHVSGIYDKLGVKNRAQCMKLAQESRYGQKKG